jgi:hypothetical protein
VPRFVTEQGGMRALERALGEALYEDQVTRVFRCDAERAWSTPGETQAAFVARMQILARERRDAKLEKLQQKYNTKLERLETKVRKAREKVSKEEDDAKAKKIDTAVSVGGAVLGALLGRRVLGRATTAARGASRVSKEEGDVRRAEAALRDAEEDFADLQIEADEELARLRAEAVEAPPITERVIRPTKKDLDVESMVLLWVPER